MNNYFSKVLLRQNNGLCLSVPEKTGGGTTSSAGSRSGLNGFARTYYRNWWPFKMHWYSGVVIVVFLHLKDGRRSFKRLSIMIRSWSNCWSWYCGIPPKTGAPQSRMGLILTRKVCNARLRSYILFNVIWNIVNQNLLFNKCSEKKKPLRMYFNA